jgi:LPXTG-motif cell wall-anchored protein
MNQPTTFVLSNEEGGLIDQLIADGHGDDSLYEVMQLLQPLSGGAIPADFMAALAACPAGSEIFVEKLNDFTGINNPVGINTDGTVIITPIFGRDYYGQTGYSSYPATLVPGGENFVNADSAAYYIDTGSSIDTGDEDGNYMAFAVAWMPSDTLTVAGTAADDTAILQIDNKTPSARDKTWEISVTSGTVKAGIAKADVTLTGLPAGLDYTAAKGTGNTIVITLTGAATTALTADATVTAVIEGSAVTEADAQDSAGISLKLWYIGEATTLVLTNEGGGYLIDKLIAAGHEDDSLYEVLELLQPDFSSVITERFMQTLASNPADSDVFDDEAALINFAGLNNPICVNADGTLSINGIFGRDYHGNEGYTTTGSNMAGVGTVWATAADDSAHLIDAGSSGVIDGFTAYYKAFAILWMPELPAVTTDAVNTSGITQNSAAVSGSVTSAGTAAVTERGFVYGASANPTTSDTKVTAALGTGTGAFSATLTGLSASTAYHVRAYAISAAGTAYGADRTFTTLTGGGPGPEDNPPTVVTNTVTGIATTGATLNGNVTSDGGATVTARGFVYGLSANPAIGGAGVTQAASGNGTGAFTANISGLTAGATYHVRAYAINSEGTSYGADVPFTTLTGGGPGPGPEDNPPTVVTNTVTGITASGATLNGNVTASDGATVTARGFVYDATANPAIGGAGVAQAASGSGTGAFTANISGLTAGSTYHVRAYATNSEGTSYGTDVTFTTLTGGGGEPDDPYIFRTLTDSATGITVSGVIHRDAALTVKNTVLHAAGTCAACDAIRARMTDSDFITLIDRDISLSLGFSGSLTITIPVGSAYNGETVTVLHCANGTLKTYTATVQDGKATFTVTSLSPFAVFADARELDNVPKTGDGGGFPLWLGLMASGVLLGSVLVLRRRPKRA